MGISSFEVLSSILLTLKGAIGSVGYCCRTSTRARSSASFGLPCHTSSSRLVHWAGRVTRSNGRGIREKKKDKPTNGRYEGEKYTKKKEENIQKREKLYDKKTPTRSLERGLGLLTQNGSNRSGKMRTSEKRIRRMSTDKNERRRGEGGKKRIKRENGTRVTRNTN